MWAPLAMWLSLAPTAVGAIYEGGRKKLSHASYEGRHVNFRGSGDFFVASGNTIIFRRSDARRGRGENGRFQQQKTEQGAMQTFPPLNALRLSGSPPRRRVGQRFDRSGRRWNLRRLLCSRCREMWQKGSGWLGVVGPRVMHAMDGCRRQQVRLQGVVWFLLPIKGSECNTSRE